MKFDITDIALLYCLAALVWGFFDLSTKIVHCILGLI